MFVSPEIVDVTFSISLLAVMLFLARQNMVYAQERIEDGRRKVHSRYETMRRQLKDLKTEKQELETQAAKIFTLYDMTREIAQKLHEEEAFQVFKAKLRDNVTFRDCRLVDARSPDVKDFRKSKEHFLFTLTEGTKKIAYLIFEGVPAQDEEKAVILSHQFALALRRVRLGQEIEKLAITDSLTGAYTRRYFMERFEEELKRSKLRNINLSLLMIDVDYFKQLNDEHGHLAGDQVLREVSRVISQNIREIDIAGRYGGEEFCVVLPDTDSRGAYFAAERIRTALEKTKFKAYDLTLQITASLGLSTYPRNGQTSEELMDKADWALYRAKKSGRNCVCAFGVYTKPTPP